MISTKLYCDTRRLLADGTAPIKISITKRGVTAYLKTGVAVPPANWDDRAQRIVKHQHRERLNGWLTRLLIDVQDRIRSMQLDGIAQDLTSTEIKNAISRAIDGGGDAKPLQTFGEFATKFIETKQGKTRINYEASVKTLYRFDKSVLSAPIHRFTKESAQKYSEWLASRYADTSRKTLLAKVSAVFTQAVRQGIIERNPFAEVRVTSRTTRKRNLSREQLHALLAYEPKTRGESIALDLFRFSFFLIGCNTVDMSRLTFNNIQNGRIEYDRAKTGKHYSIAITPELQELINKLSDNHRLFGKFSEYANYDSLACRSDAVLRVLSKSIGLPPISLYWARHSWASIAAELDIPVDTISYALGHSFFSGSRTTPVYINFVLSKVDDANRRVIDYVLYSRK